MKKILFLFLATMCCTTYAQVIHDPIKDGARTGRAYLKWELDIKHDGINDVLVTEKPTQEELKEKKDEEGVIFNPNYLSFAVYLGLGKSGNYTSDGGILVDISQCYVGYVEEVKQYGIVTVEEREVTAPSGKGRPVPMKQVYCYTVQGGHMKRTDLTPLFGIDEKNPTCDKYLSESKRTKVQLQEVTP